MALNFANNNSLSAITSLPASISGGAFTLLQTQTASSSSSISFTSNIDSTYDAYMFKFINIHAGTLDARLTFQADTGTNTNYNQTITSTSFRTFHDESDSTALMGYQTGSDQAQGTSFERLTESFAINNDDNGGGYLQIFNPSSSTFVKHFIANTNVNRNGGGISQNFQAGYFNTTTALTRFQFKMSSGTFDGVIKLYGIS